MNEQQENLIKEIISAGLKSCNAIPVKNGWTVRCVCRVPMTSLQEPEEFSNSIDSFYETIELFLYNFSRNTKFAFGKCKCGQIYYIEY